MTGPCWAKFSEKFILSIDLQIGLFDHIPILGLFKEFCSGKTGGGRGRRNLKLTQYQFVFKNHLWSGRGKTPWDYKEAMDLACLMRLDLY